MRVPDSKSLHSVKKDPNFLTYQDTSTVKCHHSHLLSPPLSFFTLSLVLFFHSFLCTYVCMGSHGVIIIRLYIREYTCPPVKPRGGQRRGAPWKTYNATCPGVVGTMDFGYSRFYYPSCRLQSTEFKWNRGFCRLNVIR